MSEWISVEDSMPEIKRVTAKVLVNVNGYGIHIDHFKRDGHFHEYDEYVTHWMPLPEPPPAEK